MGGGSATAIALAIVLLMGACDARTGDERTESQADNDSVHVAVAWSWSGRSGTSFGQGVALAVDSINAAGGILGRPLTVNRFDDQESAHTGRLVAQEIVQDGRYFAVIGHLHSHVSLAAAPMYEAAGILVITPASTAPELTRRGHRLVFRTVNGDDVTARVLARYAREQAFERIAVCYARSAYGIGLANAFETYAVDAGIEVIERRAYEEYGRTESYYGDLFGEWTDRRLDAVMLAGASPVAAQLVRALRSAGVRAPVFGGDGLDDADFVATSGRDGEGVVAASFFHPDDPRPEVRRFRRSYRERFGVDPDSWAARGYEAVLLLADAISRAGQLDALAVAHTLREAGPWRTLAGEISFSEEGDPRDRATLLVRASNGRFRFERAVVPDEPGLWNVESTTPEEVVEDAAEKGEYYDHKSPENLVTGGTRASGQLEKRDQVENHDYDTAAAQRPEVAETLDQVRPATGENERERGDAAGNRESR